MSQENDESSLKEISEEVIKNEKSLSELEFRRMFSNEMDPSNAYLDIQSGSGGTEAQDWAEMIMRMYLKWGVAKGFETEVIELSPGDVAVIKSSTIKFSGDYAYGWLRTETGVHRLVRKSPFDSGNRRHTSFASVFISTEIDESIQVNIKSSDIRTSVLILWISNNSLSLPFKTFPDGRLSVCEFTFFPFTITS